MPPPSARKRLAGPPDNPQTPKRQASSSRADAGLRSSAITVEGPPVSDSEHQTRVVSFITSVLRDLREKIGRAYIDDLDQQMRLGLSPVDQRECAKFFDEFATSFSERAFIMCCELTDELNKMKPQGSWYRGWLDGNPYLFNWPKTHKTGSNLNGNVSSDNTRSDPSSSIHVDTDICSALDAATVLTSALEQSQSQRDKAILKFGDDWQRRVGGEFARDKIEIEAKALTLNTQWADLTIDGEPANMIQEGTYNQEWRPLTNEFFLTWKFRDLPLNQKHLYAWINKRRSLATFPGIIKADTIIQWTDGRGQSHRFHPSRVDLRVTEVSHAIKRSPFEYCNIDDGIPSASQRPKTFRRLVLAVQGCPHACNVPASK